MPLNVTVEHIARIRTFLDARIKPLLDTSTGSRHGYADDDVSRGLRALTTVVMNQAAVATLIPGYSEERPTTQRYIEQATDTAWRSLCDIAREWRDHADYLPEFTLEPHELGEARVKEPQP
ncbi:hypothetical protein [Streptomyces muensis]|uniref:Uncharacterized protein n=1 Tax=Streptomyces muensis TaxID=1077944 RepID=A0A9X1TIW6_STRM4|nr:hypothetical protein [Streptomyces muensis]MCF1592390.1 hypothetical protein [Streptomyces muensis]